MIDKHVSTLTEAVQGIHEGAVLLVGGFGTSGRPVEPLASQSCLLIPAWIAWQDHL